MNLQDKANIWVPPSFSHRQATDVDKAVREYDPNLGFGLNEKTGQWCIFLKQGTNEVTQEADLPVLGFDEIPHPDDALRRLYQSDALRTGREIQKSIERNNQSIHDAKDRAAAEAVEEAAEGFDWGFRQMGKAPYSKIFIPGE